MDAHTLILSALSSLSLNSTAVPAGTSKHHAHILPELSLCVKATNLYQQDLAREAQIISQLSPHTSNIVELAPNIPAPYKYDGWSLLFTKRLTSVGTPTQAGLCNSLMSLLSELRAVDGVPTHSWLDDYKATLDAVQSLPPSLQKDLARYKPRLVEPVVNRSWPTQLIHSDAHANNAILTAQGIKWLDLESVIYGPIPYALRYLDDIEDLLPDKTAYLAFRGLNLWLLAVWTAVLSTHDPRWESRAGESFSKLIKYAPEFYDLDL